MYFLQTLFGLGSQLSMADLYRHSSNTVDILTESLQFLSLSKIPKFHLISWCGNFLKMHSFHRALDDTETVSSHKISKPRD